jgi:hypothetical protein
MFIMGLLEEEEGMGIWRPGDKGGVRRGSRGGEEGEKG